MEPPSDGQIDTADTPEILDWPDASREDFYRPIKRQITLRFYIVTS